MVVKNLKLISIAILLGLTMTQALGNTNDLVQMDLKRSSDNAIDVTLFTTDSYGDNVLVRKKSDNKYVILVPNVQSSGYSASNLSGVKDLVSNVDIKTVNDTNGGYTKVTLITTKPLDIKTKTVKNGPVTAEQKEYKTLIAQANAVKNTILTKQEPPKIREQKTEVTVNKASNIVPKTENVKQTDNKVEVNKVEDKKDVKVSDNTKFLEADKEKLQKQERKEYLDSLKNEVIEEQNDEFSNIDPVVDINNEISQENIQEKASLFTKIKNKFNNKIPKAVGIFVLALLGLSFMRKIVKSILTNQVVLPENNIENLVEELNANIDTDQEYEDISWKERYQQYLDKSAKPVSRAENSGSYKFIKTPNKSMRKKRQRLEQFVTNPQNNEIEPEIVEVQSEDTKIYNSIKLKAFENPANSLEMSSRTKSRFKRYEIERPLKEQNTVELGSSMLHSNPRRFENAALKVEDVDTDRMKYIPKEYIMSSIDEYLSILDAEKLNNKELIPSESKQSNITNPIAKTRKEKTELHEGLIVKSGFNIDSHKGFFMVNHDGKNALVGKVNDEIFVLKKFDHNVTSPIQVRQDNANVYMVRAGNFKSMVEVKNDKMGVLIEL